MQQIPGSTTSAAPPGDAAASGTRRRPPARVLREELTALGWQLRGACRGVEESVFFAPDVPREARLARQHRVVAAKRVCARCPVRELCRSYALENREEFGIWGGLSEVERKGLITGGYV